ncbi:MAG TPA: hypothetical protein VEQ38_19280 [Verrucomicrobiae bacterium]|nr:hypothetical protein [Verrucomicrobiae bacterium]
MKNPLRFFAVDSILLPVCCFAEAFTIEQVLKRALSIWPNDCGNPIRPLNGQ